MKFIEALKSTYTEVSQDSDIRFSFVVEEEGNLKQLHSFALCRDFFNEAVISSKLRVECPPIYGFKFNGKTAPCDLEHTRMALSGKDFSTLIHNLPLLNQVEDEKGIERTTIIKLDGTDYYYLIGSEIWVRGTVPISLYTHIIRCMYQFKSRSEDTFFSFFKHISSIPLRRSAGYQKVLDSFGFERIIQNLDKVFEKDHLPFPEMKTIDKVGTLHSYSGMVAFFNSVMGKYGKLPDNILFTEVKKFQQLARA